MFAVPDRYVISLKLDLAARKFTRSFCISVTIAAATCFLVLNDIDVEIVKDAVSFTSQSSPKELRPSETVLVEGDEILVFNFDEVLPTGVGILGINGLFVLTTSEHNGEKKTWWLLGLSPQMLEDAFRVGMSRRSRERERERESIPMDGDGYFEYMAADEGYVGNIMYDDDDDDRDEDLLDRDKARGGEVENEYEQLTRVTDTTSAQARRGKDIQGIPWDRLHITRENYRKTRVEQYKNYENVPSSGDRVDKKCKQMEKGGNYYEFCYNTRLVKPTILHFQLRNLVWATSKHDVYFMSNASVIHWSSISCNLSEVLNFSGHVAPLERHPGNLVEGFSRAQISTLAIKDNLLVAGGFQGELTCKCLDRPGVSFCTRTTFDENSITNAIDIYKYMSGGIRFMASNNDGGVREFDTERFQLLNHFCFPWPVNHTSMSPDGKLFTVVGDDCNGLLVDSQTGKVMSSLVGHLDYSFASAWHPDGQTFATGNQDKTCRVWDLRNLSSSVAILKGNIGAVRSISFSSNGQFVVAAEPADFVHIYSTKADYKMRQELDFFGEISGVSLSPDDESLFIGVWDRVYASLLQYSKKHAYHYLDSFV